MVTFSEFISAAATNPVLLVIIVLIAGAIFVNGATDASNAIATAIGTRSIRPTAAVAMGAACNFIGLVGMSLYSTAVADTISNMVDFGTDSGKALMALAAAMLSIIVWGVAAWRFGIPTSQSHSLIAGLTGAAIAVQGGLDGVNFDEWVKVIYGLVVSTVLGFGLGWLLAKLLARVFSKMELFGANKAIRAATVGSAAFLALMHGAQDGQKFMSIAMLGVVLAIGGGGATGDYPLWIMAGCALTMALGSGLGGRRIIKSVGMGMVKLETYQGLAASLSASVCLLLATLTGMPTSTTHTNTTAVMGAGSAKRLRDVRWDQASNMVLTWVFTFPGCGLIGFVLAKVFMVFG